MTHAWIGLQAASCVDVWPVDCLPPSQKEPGLHESEQLFINPDEGINGGAWEPACPVTAIFPKTFSARWQRAEGWRICLGIVGAGVARVSLVC